MARTSNRKSRAVRIFTNGKRADTQYALSDQLGRIVRRTDVAKTRAMVSLGRRAITFTRAGIVEQFNVRPGLLTNKLRVETTGDSLIVHAHQRRIPLLAFGGRWGGASTPGATASIVRGKSETYTSAFIAKVGKDRRPGIRVRKQLGARRAPRGPLQMLYGPSPYDMVHGYRADAETRTPLGRYKTDVREKVTARLLGYYVGELRRQYALESSRGK